MKPYSGLYEIHGGHTGHRVGIQDYIWFLKNGGKRLQVWKE
jgi:hypothetical protein